MEAGRRDILQLLVDSLECEDAFELRTRHPMFSDHTIRHLLAATSRPIREQLIRHMSRPTEPEQQFPHAGPLVVPGDEAGPWQEYAIRLLEDGRGIE